jgi:hypothetical protein
MKTKIKIALMAGGATALALVAAKLITDSNPGVSAGAYPKSSVTTPRTPPGGQAMDRLNRGPGQADSTTDVDGTAREAQSEAMSENETTQRSSTEAEIIRRARRASAAQMERGLPDEPLEDWLKRSLGPGVAVEWEINDCGEFDGSGQQESVPVCADAEAKFADGRTISIWIAVGSQDLQGTNSAPDFSGDPAVWWAALSSRSTGCRIRLADIAELVDLYPERMSSDQVNRYCGGQLFKH